MGIEAYQAPESRHVREPRVKDGPKNDNFHLILLAQTYEGYMNLLRLSDEANRTGFYYYPRVDWELLEKYNEGIIATSACMGGLMAQEIKQGDLHAFHRFRDIFRDKFFIEIHTYESTEQKALNTALMDVCESWGVWPIVANDAHYPSPDEYDEHELMVAINEGRKFDPNDLNDRRHPKCLYIMSEDEVKEHLSYLDADFVKAAIDNTDVIAAASEYTMPEVRSHLPKYPRSKNPSLSLVEKVEAWCANKPEEYIDRAIMELEALTNAGLADYFLIVEDFCKWADENDIMRGPGRGSVGGALVAYALGITDVDPIKYDLVFERFWNPGRAKGLPDIDIDLEEGKRPKVKEYLGDTYGEDRVRGIGNHIRFRPKSAMKRAAMALGANYISYGDAEAISKIIDKTTDAGLMADWDAIEDLVGKELNPYIIDYPDLFHYARALTGRISTYGVHASAVVISDVDLPGNLPLMRRKDKNKNEVFVTAHDMYGVEAQGFPKFDLLGLSTLDVLKKTITLANWPDFDFRSIDYNAIPEGEGFWELIDRGRTLGLFQIEAGGAARRIGKQMKPRSVLDLAAIVALNRPGPLRSHATDRYLARRAGDQELEYMHPFMEQFLGETYGEIIYQEQVIQLCVGLGYSLSDADEVRKILGKKNKEDMIREEGRFMSMATPVMGVRASDVWDAIQEFAKYSFNKSHAVGYGLITAWTTYAKWRWPQEFIMASIMVSPDKRGDFIADARRMGITVNAPDVNKSDLQISRVDDDIYLGLTEIKYVGKNAAQWVIDHRPEGGYKSYAQFAEIHQAAIDEHKSMDKILRPKLSPSQICNARAIQCLVQAGAFDAIMERDIPLGDRIELENDLLGVVLADIYTPVINANEEALEDTMSYADLEEFKKGKVPGIVTAVRSMKVGPGKKNAGKEMGHLTVEWEGEELRLTVFPEDWADLPDDILHQVGVFLVEQNSRGTSIRSWDFLNG